MRRTGILERGSCCQPRTYLHSACHEKQDLAQNAVMTHGNPPMGHKEIFGRHDWYYSDAYPHDPINIAMDHL